MGTSAETEELQAIPDEELSEKDFPAIEQRTRQEQRIPAEAWPYRIYPHQPRRERMQALAAWLSVPPDLRPYPSLAAWMRQEGIQRTAQVYELLREPEVQRMAMGASVASILDRLPAVLQALSEAAEAGSARAAETLLRHVREVTGYGAGQQPAAHQALHIHLQDTDQAAQRLLTLAQGLQRWDDRARGAIAADMPAPGLQVDLATEHGPEHGPEHGAGQQQAPGQARQLQQQPGEVIPGPDRPSAAPGAAPGSTAGAREQHPGAREHGPGPGMLPVHAPGAPTPPGPPVPRSAGPAPALERDPHPNRSAPPAPVQLPGPGAVLPHGSGGQDRDSYISNGTGTIQGTGQEPGPEPLVIFNLRRNPRNRKK